MLIGLVGDDRRVRDAFDADAETFDVETEAPAGTWGLLHGLKGHGSLEYVPIAAPGSALAGVYALAAKRGLSPFHPPEVVDEAAEVVADPGISDRALESLTRLPFVTIDEDRSRDLDQALFVERRGRGFKVWYAIADPSWSVRPGTALFAEALRRGATYYLPGLVVPMLPRVLSEGVISLNPQVDRRALVFEVDLEADGTVAGTRIRRGRVKSRLKTSYDAVQDFLDGRGRLPGASAQIRRSLELLREVGTLRRELAEAHDVISFQRHEIAVSVSGADGLRYVAMADPRNDVERYNEQISLLCNVEGARFLHESGAGDGVQPIYRVHGAPTPESLAALAEEIEALVRVRGLDESRWRWRRGEQSLASYLESLPASGREARLARAVNRQAMLTGGRSGFAAAPSAHYGVGAEVYARFTAPMREVVGVFLHKETWEKLHGKTGTAPPPPWDDDERLREQVIEAANRARQTQRELDGEVNRRVLDQLFGDDFSSALERRPARRGTVLGISQSKVHVGLDDPPIDVKVYHRHIAAQLAARVGQGDDRVTLRRLDGGERLQSIGDEVRLRVRGRDEEHDRWELELLPGGPTIR